MIRLENECTDKDPSFVEIIVTESGCPRMPKFDTLVLEGPSLIYSKSGPVCITALNGIYPWVMATRFDVRSPVLDYDEKNNCYHCVCPCGKVSFDIRKTEEY